MKTLSTSKRRRRKRRGEREREGRHREEGDLGRREICLLIQGLFPPPTPSPQPPLSAQVQSWASMALPRCPPGPVAAAEDKGHPHLCLSALGTKFSFVARCLEMTPPKLKEANERPFSYESEQHSLWRSPPAQMSYSPHRQTLFASHPRAAPSVEKLGGAPSPAVS